MVLQRAADVELAVNDHPTTADLDAFEHRIAARITGFALLVVGRLGAAANGFDGLAVQFLAKEIIGQWNGFEFFSGKKIADELAERSVEFFRTTAGVGE